MKTEANLGMIFEAILEEFSKRGKPYIREGTIAYCGMNFKVPTFSKSI
jgi:hypothetical protein